MGLESVERWQLGLDRAGLGAWLDGWGRRVVIEELRLGQLVAHRTSLPPNHRQTNRVVVWGGGETNLIMREGGRCGSDTPMLPESSAGNAGALGEGAPNDEEGAMEIVFGMCPPLFGGSLKSQPSGGQP